MMGDRIPLRDGGLYADRLSLRDVPLRPAVPQATAEADPPATVRVQVHVEPGSRGVVVDVTVGR